MRRWNGWGEEATTYPLPESAALYLSGLLGPGTAHPDVTFSQVLATVPPSRLPTHPMITTNPDVRALHARGQSLPDWVALRAGRIDAFPDGVAFPDSDDDIRSLLALASESGTRLIPYGGGTSVVGHINPLPAARPVLTVDLGRMTRLIDLDETSLLASFQAGVRGPDLEAQLNARGYTLGHYPQSFELSTLGGWIATRSSGQQSYHYGRIEDLFAGGCLETPLGALELPPFPASAAGPDLRHLVLGCEGRLGMITRAIVRVRPLPEAEAFYGVFFRDWESGVAAVRAIAQARAPVSMLRLSDPQETDTTLRLSGGGRLVALADSVLRRLGYGSERCLLIIGFTGDRRTVAKVRRQATGLLRSHGGFFPLQPIGAMWRKSRFLTPYLRNTLWELGYAVDTFETAGPWSSVHPLAAAAAQALRDSLEHLGEKVHAFAHLSHVYADGASVYCTAIFRRSAEPDETLARWREMKAAVSQAFVAYGGTISHQHGVGIDHMPYLTAEKGVLGLAALEAARAALDPDSIMNPGKLIPSDVPMRPSAQVPHDQSPIPNL
ncbi:MAG TPA: FAD-binding oxidoreductase [Anaerolineales bacterium]|nr:FAD-binding oxidoreductase [Anaerolineales bacterium]